MTDRISALDQPMKTYRARCILPDSRRVLERGSITIQGDLIQEISAGSPGDGIDLGDVVVMPGLINAHVHLDLSAVEGPIPADQGMADWLAAVVQVRRSGESASRAILRRVIGEMTEAGTAVIGDICTSEAGREVLGEIGLAGVVFREVLGLKPERFEPLWQSAVSELDTLSPLVAGISPHAPYSTSREVYRRCCELESRIPLATHWLESPEEIEFLGHGRGPLRDFLEDLGAFSSPWQPVEDVWLDFLGAGRWNLVHANFLSDPDVHRLQDPVWRKRVAAVTYCPRTHAHFRHPTHPWKRLLDMGIPVALGTDSLASNPDLSVLGEARWLAARHPEVAPSVYFDMATIHGARALALEGRYGTLEAGKSATMTVFEHHGLDPLEHVVDPDVKVVGLMVDGRWLRVPPGVG